MHIAVDASCWANRRGYGRFAREISTALVRSHPQHRWTFIGDRRAFARHRVEGSQVENVTVERGESPTLAASAEGYRSVADMWRWMRVVKRVGADVFFSPSVYTYFPIPFGQRAVVTVHDAIAERFPHLTLPSPRARLFWKLKVGLALRQANVVLTVSQHAARDLVRVLGVPPARLRVAVEAPSPVFAPAMPGDIERAAAAAGLPSGARWFIYCGGFNPHKRVDLVVRAHAGITRSVDSPPHLVLVGTLDNDVFHGAVNELRAMVRTEGTSHLVHWAGYLEDDELRLLNAGAIGALLPSECEGFGLPAVEAAACGTPVIATTESPLPELLEGGGIFVAPADAAALENAMRTLATDPALRDRMATEALRRARELTWERCSADVMSALTQAAAA